MRFITSLNRIVRWDERMSNDTPLLDKANLSSIQYLGPAEVTPHPKNPRTHSDRQIQLIANSIRAHGFTVPILIDEKNQILAGHGRLMAAKYLQLAKVPTIQVTHLNESEKLAVLIADNKLTELADWDKQILALNFSELQNLDFDVELTAFSTAEIDLIIEPAAQNKNQAKENVQLPDPDQQPVSRVGDLWQLGEHRLYCGDAKNAASYVALMRGEYAQMVFSDPPYNVPVDGHVCGSGRIKHREFVEASGEMTSTQFTTFLRTVFDYTAAHSVEGSIHYYFMDWRHIGEITSAGQAVFGVLKQLCVWNKDNAGMGSFYRSKHELVFVFKKGNAGHINNFKLGEHGRYRTNVWDYPGVNTLKSNRMEELGLHPTVKPIGLAADAIRDCSKRGGIILDPFCGSGTTIMAAERTGRKAYTIELDPLYVDTAIRRWQDHTGLEAKLLDSGQSFAQIEADRLQSGQTQTIGEWDGPK
jgi:DNA modification methylase